LSFSNGSIRFRYLPIWRQNLPQPLACPVQPRLHRSHLGADNLRDLLERDAFVFEKDQGFPLNLETAFEH
jgi:hypothetical protein